MKWAEISIKGLAAMLFLAVAGVTAWMVQRGDLPGSSEKVAEAREPAQNLDPRVGFARLCSSCHDQFTDPSQFLGSDGKLLNAATIVERLKWVAKGEGAFGRGRWKPAYMPKDMRESDYRREAPMLAAMLRFARASVSGGPGSYDLTRLKVPQDLKITLYARVPGARSMTVAPDGRLYVGTGGFSNPKSVVYRIPGRRVGNGFEAGPVDVLVDGMDNPNGVALLDGDLYVAEQGRLLGFLDIISRLPNRDPNRPELLRSEGVEIRKFPDQEEHSWKYLRAGPDKKLYYSVGAPCNVCLPEEAMGQAAIHQIDPARPGVDRILARGVRNSVGFDMRPGTQELWFTDNGRDALGDNLPDDELNKIDLSTTGHFGFPHCYSRGTQVVDDARFSRPGFCPTSTGPVAGLGAHVAALGMRFVQGTALPERYRGKIIVAQHGSWNRSRKSGYKVVMVDPTTGVVEDFITGWLNSATDEVWGRPVDIEQLPDGSLLISDDGLDGSPFGGAIYHVESR